MGNTNQKCSSPEVEAVVAPTVPLKEEEEENSVGKIDKEGYDRKIGILMDDDNDLQEYNRIVKSLKSKETLEYAAIVELAKIMKRKFEDLVLGLNCHLSDDARIEKAGDGNICYRSSPAKEDLVPLLNILGFYEDDDEDDGSDDDVCSKNSIPPGTALEASSEHVTGNDHEISESEDADMESVGSSSKDERDPITSPERAMCLNFDERLEALKKFKAEHGNLNVERKLDESLAQWCENIRCSFRAKERGLRMKIVLTDDRIGLLNELGFDFFNTEDASKAGIFNASAVKNGDKKLGQVHDYSPTPKGLKLIPFCDRVETLQQFKAKFGHLNVTESVDKSLAKWCDNVRYSYHAKERGCKMRIKLTDEGIAILETMGFDFIGNESERSEDEGDETENDPKQNSTHFNERLKALKRFKAKYGHINVTEGRDELLARWCRSVRYSYAAKKRGTRMRVVLTDESIASLKKMGFDFSNCKGVQFDDRIRALKMYKAKYGHINVTESVDESLAKWCGNVRYSYDAKQRGTQMRIKLTDEGIATLNELGFNFECTETHEYDSEDERESRRESLNSPYMKKRSIISFSDRIKALEKFKAKHGHLNVTAKMDYSLKNWCSNVRTSYRLKQLGRRTNIAISDERIAALKKLGFQFDKLETTNEKGIDPNENHSSSDEDVNSTTSKSGNRWESLNSPGKGSGIISFSDRLKALEKFKAKHGHLNVTISVDKSLGYWCSNVRTAYRWRNTDRKTGIAMTDDRIAALKELGFLFPKIETNEKEEDPNENHSSSDEDDNTTTSNSDNRWVSLNTPGMVNGISFSDRLEALEEFKAKHGHLNVTIRKDKSLANWCSNIRASYRSRHSGTRTSIAMTDDRIAALKELGFPLPKTETANESDSDSSSDEDDNTAGSKGESGQHLPQSPSKVTFSDRIKELEEFKAEHGHLYVPPSVNKSLSRWCSNVRSSYRFRHSGRKANIAMTDERIAMLEKLGFDFFINTSLAVRSNKTGQDKKMTETQENTEHEDVMAEEADGPESPSKETTGLSISPLDHSDEIFNNRLKDLQRFKDVHGHFRATASTDKSLARWCENIRKSYRAKLKGEKMRYKLTNERIAVLEKIGFVFITKATDETKAHLANGNTGNENVEKSEGDGVDINMSIEETHDSDSKGLNKRVLDENPDSTLESVKRLKH